MKRRTVQIVIPMLTAILILGGCGKESASKKEILDLLNTSDTITIELTTTDTEDGTQCKVNWVKLGDMTSSKEIRDCMDEQFKITGNAGNKNGVFYVNEKGENTQNNTLAVAMKNRAFTTIFKNKDDLELVNYNILSKYADLDSDSEKAIYVALSDYFELLPASESGESNIDDGLSRAEAMSLVMKAVTPVDDSLETKSDFEKAVGENDYNVFASKEDKHVFISTADGSLNSTTYIQNMTKAEYVYMVMNEVFGEETVKKVDSTKPLNGLANAGNLRYSEELMNREQVSSAIIKSFVNNPTKVDENIYKAIVLANDKNIISETDDMDSAITKGEAVEILCKALMQNKSISEFNYNNGTIDTGYVAEPETKDGVNGNGAGEVYEPTEEDLKVSDEATIAQEQPAEQPAQPAEQSAPAFNVEPMDLQTMFAQQRVNLRQGPGTEYEKVNTYSLNDEVKVNGLVQNENKWYQIVDDNGNVLGYSAASYFSTSKVEIKKPTPKKNTTSNSSNSSGSSKNNSSSGSSNNSSSSSNNSGSSNSSSSSSTPTESVSSDDGATVSAGGSGDGSGSSRENRGSFDLDVGIGGDWSNLQ